MLTPSCLWFLLPMGSVLKPHAGLSACDGTGPSRWYPGSTFTKAPHPVLISALSHEIIPASGIRRRRVRSRREKTAHSHPTSHRPGTQACGWPGSMRQEWGTKPRQAKLGTENNASSVTFMESWVLLPPASPWREALWL